MDDLEKEVWLNAMANEKGSWGGVMTLMFYLTFGALVNREKHLLARDLLKLSWESS